MITEIAEIHVLEGHEESFVEAYHEAIGLVAETPGFGSVRLTRSIETPTRFVLLVEWDSVEAHMVFRDSDRFPRWRELIGPHFARPPHVEHLDDVA